MPRRPSVALIGPTHPYKGGIAQHTTELAFRLAQAGREVRIESWSRQYPARLYPGQQRVSEPDGRRFPDVTYDLSWRSPISWVRVGRRLATTADEVVIVLASPVQVPIYLVVLLALRLRLRRGDRRPAVLVLAHNVAPHESRRGDELLVRLLLRRADGVLVHSAHDLDSARQLGARRVERARLPPHLPGSGVGDAADEKAQRAVGVPTERIELLFFGLVRPYKGLDVLFRALAKAPGQLRLTVAGEFWEPVEGYRRLAAELGIPDRVTLRPGYVSADEVAVLLAAADVLVLPYRSATGSQNVDLAFAHGLPVVATGVGALAESVRDGANGFVVAPEDVDGLAGALTQLCEPGRLSALREGVEQTVPRDDWPAYLGALVALADHDG